jgi:hypothetical protein
VDLREAFGIGKTKEEREAEKGDEESSANAVIRREYVKLGSMR